MFHHVLFFLSLVFLLIFKIIHHGNVKSLKFMWKNKSVRINRKILKNKDSEGLTRYFEQ